MTGQSGRVKGQVVAVYFRDDRQVLFNEERCGRLT